MAIPWLNLLETVLGSLSLVDTPLYWESRLELYQLLLSSSTGIMFSFIWFFGYKLGADLYRNSYFMVLSTWSDSQSQEFIGQEFMMKGKNMNL